MSRTVKVGLLLDVARYLRPARDAKSATDGVSDALDEAAKSGDKAATASDRLGGELAELTRDARRLDAQIDDTARGIRDLAREIARTSDEAKRAELSKKLNVEQGKLREKVDLRKLIDTPDVDRAGSSAGLRFATRMGDVITNKLAKLGEPFGSALSASFSSMPPQAQAAVGAGVAALVAAVAPVAGAAIAGAVVGAVGTGGVVGGLALAAKDARVRAEASSVGDAIGEMLGESSSAFVPVAIEQLGEVRSELMSWQPELESIFSTSAGYADELVDAGLGFVREMLPGIRDAVQAGEPFFRMLAEELPELGGDLGEAFSLFAEHADEGAAAVGAILDYMGLVVDTTSEVIGALATVYGWYLAIDELTGGGERKTGFAKMKGDVDGYRDALGGAVPATRDLAGAASEAAAQVELLDDKIRRLADQNITAEQANIRLEEAIDRATAAGQRNSAGIDAGTEKGRANRQLLVGLASAANDASSAIFAQTGNQALANEAAERGRAKFLAAAAAMGVEKDEALRLADQLFAIPKTVTTKVRALTDAATGALIGFEKKVRALDGTVITIRTRLTRDGEHIPGAGTQLKNRWGGVYTHARDGLVNLRDAAVYSPMGPARYAFAEPETGGEAFVPKYGDRSRSLSILGTAAAWYGAQVMPAGARQVSGPPTVTNHFTITGGSRSPQEIAQEVASIIGRQANILTR